jgi:CRP-like cAMP-binding protein
VYNGNKKIKNKEFKMKELDERKKLKEYITLYNLEAVLPESSIDILQLNYFDADQLIVEESTPVNYLHILLKGKCRVSPTSEEGKTALLDFVLPKDVIGDIEFFSKDQYYHNVTTILPCVSLSIPVKFIDRYFGNNVDFYKFLCENMARKMKSTSLKYSNTLLYPIKNQIASYFYSEFVKNEQIVLPIVFKDLSDFFGITPRYFRNILAEFESERILLRETSGVKLLDLEKLRHYTSHN